ncbi:MAG: T9SS type A sorting domain-containing protein [Dysgonamonadaceae bacterium]|jgi:hypothetical protein|nr:T9SS type A sorting domain-containing protein [Dysgonamonadaceae bacterium]
MKRNFLLFVALFSVLILQAQIKQVAWEVIASRDNGLEEDGDVGGGHLIWGDYNNDGYKDAFFIGGMWGANAILWKNNGDGTFTKVQSEVFEKLFQADAVWIDYDNDGDLDLVTMGVTNPDGGYNTANVYENTGLANNYAFVKDETRSEKVKSFAVNTGSGNSLGKIIQAIDYDHDGWMDLLICGDAHYNVYGWDLNANDGAGDWGWLWDYTGILRNEISNFNQKDDLVVTEGGGRTNFVFFTKGSVHVGDVNGDGYADLLVQGYGHYGNVAYAGRLYINNQDGTFGISPYSSQLHGSEEYETIFTDLNGDGYDDLVEFSRAVANIHINDGEGSFTKYDTNTNGLICTNGVSIAAGDVNNDGLTDLLVSGLDGHNEDIPHELGTTKIFYNNGDFTFTAAEVPENMRTRSGGSNLVDMDNDGNLDYANTGWGNGWTTAFAINKLGEDIPENTAPATPDNFTVSYADGKYVLSWDAASDAETATSALRYNVFVKDEDGKIYAYAPVDELTGRLKIGGQVTPLIIGTSIELNLPEALYTFGVQTIDQSDLGSAFETFYYDPNQTGIKEIASTGTTVGTVNKSIEVRNTVSSAIHYVITAVNGQVVEEGTVPAGANRLSQPVTSGVYLVKLSGDQATYTQKVVVF